MEQAIVEIFNHILIFMGFIATMLFMGPALGGAILWFCIALLWYQCRLKKSHCKSAKFAYYGILALYAIVAILYLLTLLGDFKHSALAILLNSCAIFIAHWLAVQLSKILRA